MKSGGFLGVFCLIAGLAWSADGPSGDLIVFHAGSLSVPMKEMAAAFAAEYPAVRVLAEASGSRECARKISDLGKPCDVMASSDYAVIDTLLIPKFADWNIKFAGNEMAIVFTGASKYADEINGNNWHEILRKTDVAFGRADPNSDPCGYRTVLTMKLAEDFYRRPGLADALAGKDLRYMRPKETDLLALLETRTIDYLFLYRSVAVQHGLKWLTLPNEINLKDAALADHYKTVSVEITGEKPGTTIIQHGEPMVYGITIPKNAPNPKAAMAFTAFLLDKGKGLTIMEKNGQPPLVPAISETYEKIPESLRKYVLKP
ncbi:MAG TPA: tungstate ABC transporter substrate-binding protein WtpA [Candidatus Hydrogenedentes bacterium]|nr:tungstate ABC transporter substrate-binding protein WtpA [Candidatus Hydrogenedentota bacterium]HRT18901.1 tungstate ABC transporter substrate-binding protein WtpA [Candidatus Hydrogenedentota bacterium]HRT64987.1 tungstate ABC transporter substrate-binding protein WtpA [Candidatus Hydrogenedentota bacterium]